MIDREKLFTEERSRRILETAIELAEKGGFAAVRLRDVAEQAGVALGTVYKRFQSKEDMLVAALEMQMEQVESHIVAEQVVGETPLERAISLLSLFTMWLCGRPKLARAVLRAMAAGEPALSDKIASFQSRVDAFLVGALRDEDPKALLELDGQVEGHISPDEIQLAHMIQNQWFAALVGWSARLFSESEIMEQVRDASELLILGQQVRAEQSQG